MRCVDCKTDLGSEDIIKSIEGVLLCVKCAVKNYSEQDLLDLSEDVVPSDIGIYPICEWCGEESSTITKKDERYCKKCSRLINWR